MRRLALALLSTCLSAATCHRPLDFGVGGELKDPAAVLARLDARSARILSLKAEAKVRVKTPDRSGTVDEFVAVLRPAALHLETLNFFGKPVAVLASDGERFSLFLEENGTWYTGPATPENVSRLLPLVLDGREAVMLLLGDVPRIPAQEARLEVDVEARAYLLTLKAGPVTQRLWVDTATLAPIRSQVRGAAAYDLEIQDWTRSGSSELPRAISLSTVKGDGSPAGTEISIRYKDVELNGAIDVTLFSLDQPPGSKRVDVDELGRPAPLPPPTGTPPPAG